MNAEYHITGDMENGNLPVEAELACPIPKEKALFDADGADVAADEA